MACSLAQRQVLQQVNIYATHWGNAPNDRLYLALLGQKLMGFNRNTTLFCGVGKFKHDFRQFTVSL